MKYLFLILLFLNLFGASQIKVNNLSQEISTPMFYINTDAVVDRIEYFARNSKNIQAIKVYDTLRNKIYLSYYKTTHNFFKLLYKDVPKNIKLSNFIFTTNVLYEGDKIGKIEVYYYNKLNFNKQQIEYIKKHSVITAHNESDWAPYNYNINGQPMGYSIDYMKLLGSTLGINVKFITGYTWGKYLEMVKNNKIDVILNIVKTPQREKYLIYTNKAYLSLKDAIFTLDDKYYSSMNDLKGKKLVVIKGFFEIPIIKKHYPKIKLIIVNGSKEGFKTLSEGKADALINDVQVGNYLISKYKYNNIKISFYPSLKTFSSKLYIATNKQNKILKSILDKGMANIPEDYIMQLQNKWFSNISSQTKAFYLTKKEIQFLKHNNIIRMCVNPDWNPIEFVQNGIPQGISIDTMKLIRKILQNKIKLEYIKTSSWEESQKFLKEKKCDILPSAVKTKNRLNYANFTKPYMHYKMMLITKKNIDFITSLEKYKKQVFVRKEGSGIINILKKEYPNIKINETKTYKEMFEEVSDGKAFGVIATLPVSLYYIRQYGFTDLKVSGNLDKTYNLSIAVRKDRPYLLSILDKALSNISENQHQKIFDKWTSFKIVKQTDYSLIIKIVTFLLFVIMIIIYYNRKLSKAMKLAQESTKLKSNFLANMSHEIRTPMNGIIGMTHLVLQTELKPKQKDYINKIDSSAKSLLGIINDILDFSKIEAGKLTIEKINFDLFKAIEQVITINGFKANNKGLELIVDYDIKLGKIFYGDSLRISQIITNLLSNAIKFTDNGEIRVKIKYITRNRVKFEVIDNGIGLTDEQKEKLFHSFTQADGSITRKYGGTGLGLAISKKLVELMNGTIWVESEYKKGSSFIFEIELQKQDEENEKKTIFKNKKALIVDDTESWLKIISYLLKEFGLYVESVKSGEDALKILSKKQFDVVFIDWKMEGLNGIETVKQLKKNQIRTEFILISSYEEENLKNSAKNIGINYFIPKPINPSVLNDTLSDIFLGTDKLIEEVIEDNAKNLQKDIKSLKGSKILVVEDNKTNQEIILGLLENSGIIIDIANNGQEAVNKYQKNNDYELILMDLQMPIMDGYEATKLIRNQDKKIPIIALTANAMKEDIDKTKKAGMNKHLNKPIEVEKLYMTLLKYISKKVTINIIENKENTQKNDEFLPTFENIDTNYGLNLVLNNKKIFLDILKGLYTYKGLKLEETNNEEFKRLTHTIKGISASAGALKLHKIVKELDETQNRELLNSFYIEFNKVIQEIEDKIINLKNNSSKEEKKELPNELRNELFDNLKKAVYTKRAKNTKPIIEKIGEYNLSDKDKQLFDKVEILVKKFKFKEAIELF